MWSEGFVEEVVPPSIPYHVFVQQFLTLVLQNSDFVRSDWPAWIGKVPAFAELQEPAADLLKFGNLLPAHLLRDLILARIADIPHACEILRSLVRIIDDR